MAAGEVVEVMENKVVRRLVASSIAWLGLFGAFRVDIQAKVYSKFSKAPRKTGGKNFVPVRTHLDPAKKLD